MARYQQIADELRSEILAGRYSSTDRLPSQRALADRWDTTIITIRQAIAALQEEGWLRVEHGTGTFVGDPGRYADLFHVASFEQDLAARGIPVESRLVSVGHGEDEEATSVLRADESALPDVVRVVRLRLIENQPFLYQESFIATGDAAEVLDYRGHPSLYAFLREQLGLMVAGYIEDIVSTTLDGEVADLLGMDSGAVGLRSSRTSIDSRGTLVVFDRAYLPSSRVRLHVERFGTRVDLQYLPSVEPANTASLTEPRQAQDA